MKTKSKLQKNATALSFLSMALIGSASAATTSSKDGMMHTTGGETRMDGLPMLAAGVKELGVSGKLNWDEDTIYSFDITYGRFVTPNWLLGGEAGITGVDSDNDYRAGLFAEYNFLTNSQWVPFIRATASYVHPHIGDDAGLFDLDAGVKYFIRSNLAISASVGGGWTTDGDSAFEKQVNIGLKFYFD